MDRKRIIGMMAAVLLLTACEEGDRGRLTQRGHSLYSEWSGRTELFVKVNIEPLFWLNEWMLAETEEEKDSLRREVNPGFDVEKLKSWGDTVFLIPSCYIWQNGYDFTTPILVATHGDDLQRRDTEWEVVLNVPYDYEYEPSSGLLPRQTRRVPPAPQGYCEGNGKGYLPLTMRCREAGHWTLRDEGDEEVRKVLYVNWIVERTVRVELLPEETDYRYVLTGTGRYAFDAYERPDRDVIMDYDMSGVALNGRQGRCMEGEVNMTAVNRVTEEEIRASATIGNREVEINYQDVTERYHEY